MSDSQRVMSRFIAVAFLIAVGAGIVAYTSHSNLKAAERQVVALEQSRDSWMHKFEKSEMTAVENATEAKTCTAQVEEFKSRAETAETTLEDMKSKKPAKSARSSAS